VWIFIIFQLSKICVNPIGVISFLSPPWCCLSSGWCHNVVAPYRASFPWSQDEFAVSALYFDNASSHHLPSRAEPKHWMHTTTNGHPLRTTQLPPSTAIKGHLNIGNSPHHSTPPWCCLSSDWCHNTAAPYRASFPWSQDEFAVSALYFDNASCHLPSRTEPKHWIHTTTNGHPLRTV
jgi:hypothetical protein